ncbi:MAG: SGNH/GDSL hydrolase family protein [Phycisphaerae bacterium]
MNIVCLGDSITAAGNVADAQRWPILLQTQLETWRPGRYVVYSRGVGGDTTAMGLERYKEGVLGLKPGLAIFMFGFNDANCREWMISKPRVSMAEFSANLYEMGVVAKKHGIRAVYGLNHPTGPGDGNQGDGRSYPKRMLAYNRAVRAVARRLRAGVMDYPAYLRKQKIALPTIMADYVHLNALGNQHLADCAFAVVQAELTKLD